MPGGSRCGPRASARAMSRAPSFHRKRVDLLPAARQQATAAAARAEPGLEVAPGQGHGARARMDQQAATLGHRRHGHYALGASLGLRDLDDLVALATVQ